ncbi:hypothetical protein [Taibaiella soli]|uniref:hypothetical protein n=1 Tax=Taibaiella soli TaxID=1649169 RepID=UPI000F4F58F7|nr:hypothetical protein [Taibaiella soli]
MQKVQAKYVKIRNAALKDVKVGDILHSSQGSNLNEYKQACETYGAQYYLDLIGLEHNANCSDFRSIYPLVEESRKLREGEKKRLPKTFDSLIEKPRQNWIAQINKYSDALKRSTSSLNEINTNHYWAIVIAQQHLEMYEAVASMPIPRKEIHAIHATFPAKFYALYHWLKIEMGTERQFAKNANDQFIKSEIEAFVENTYPECSKQGFYRSFINLDISNRTAIAKSFGKGYKEKLIALSNNDSLLISRLKNYPN